jgi:spermidine synthase
MDVIRDGWFSEVNAMWPGQCLSLQVTEVLYHEKSKFQDIMVFQRLVHVKVFQSCSVVFCMFD